MRGQTTTTVRYIWSETDMAAGTIFPEVAARHAQIKLRAYAPTRGLAPRVRWLPISGQFEVEFTLRAYGPPQPMILNACSELVLRNVAPWVKRETVLRLQTETRPARRGAVLGDCS